MRWLYDRWLFFALVAVAIWLLFYKVIEFWTVPSDDPVLAASVVPTLRAGESVLLLRRGEPRFGEVVRCTHPEDASKIVVGRVFGTAGDTVEVDNATVIVNSKSIATSHACKNRNVTVTDPSTDETVELLCDLEEGGAGFHERARSATQAKVGRRPAQVQTDQLFLVSDDRQFPYDSRDFGAVAASECRTIVVRLWGQTGWLDAERRLTYIR